MFQELNALFFRDGFRVFVTIKSLLHQQDSIMASRPYILVCKSFLPANLGSLSSNCFSFSMFMVANTAASRADDQCYRIFFLLLVLITFNTTSTQPLRNFVNVVSAQSSSLLQLRSSSCNFQSTPFLVKASACRLYVILYFIMEELHCSKSVKRLIRLWKSFCAIAILQRRQAVIYSFVNSKNSSAIMSSPFTIVGNKLIEGYM